MVEGGQVHDCHTVEQWREHFDREKTSDKLVVVDFVADCCGPCRFVAPTVAEFAKEMQHVLFLKVNVNKLKDVSKEYKVEAMPTFILLKEGKVIDRVVGAKKDELQMAIEKHAMVTA